MAFTTCRRLFPHCLLLSCIAPSLYISSPFLAQFLILLPGLDLPPPARAFMTFLLLEMWLVMAVKGLVAPATTFKISLGCTHMSPELTITKKQSFHRLRFNSKCVFILLIFSKYSKLITHSPYASLQPCNARYLSLFLSLPLSLSLSISLPLYLSLSLSFSL